jgi:hypothetical protein
MLVKVHRPSELGARGPFFVRWRVLINTELIALKIVKPVRQQPLLRHHPTDSVEDSIV